MNDTEKQNTCHTVCFCFGTVKVKTTWTHQHEALYSTLEQVTAQ